MGDISTGTSSEGKLSERKEAEVFSELASLCVSPGYIHAIAYFCFRDNLIKYSGQLGVKDMGSHYEGSSLLRSEISTLIGLMARSPIVVDIPAPRIFQSYIERTDELMKELHHSMMAEAFFSGKDWHALFAAGRDPFQDGAAMREPIFYGGESAYNFQYEALTQLKYEADDGWLVKMRGFRIADALAVTKAIGDFHLRRLSLLRREMRTQTPDQWTFLPAFAFTTEDIATSSGVEIPTIEAVLSSFRFGSNERNEPFAGLSEFNETNVRPILHLGDGTYVLLQHYQLQESLYESPFFWMMADDDYREIETKNRGAFTESYSSGCLRAVFGDARVLTNVDIYRGKNRYAEADALVLFGNHAIVVQAKSKRLTLNARKGNDLALRDDFKKAVANAYDQALLCADALQRTGEFVFRDATRKELKIGEPVEFIYPMCVLADHYPALTFQARHFLKVKTSEIVRSPLVTDVFTLEVIAEFLETPLHFLNYLELRARAYDKLVITNELIPLSYHLRNNLWLDDKYDMVNLGDDFTAHIDVAMAVRRQGASGSREIKGVLTRYRGTPIGSIVEQIEAASIPQLTEVGIWLLQLSDSSANGLSRALENQNKAAVREGHTKDISLPFNGQRAGLTIHISSLPDNVARDKILQHARLKKYDLKAERWYGMVLRPGDLRIRLAVVLTDPWQANSEMDAVLVKLPRRAPAALHEVGSRARKIGRNELCSCGSGVKYKKCCLNR
ncbi:SEC-C metal-binding domain-containing protein [Rhizobium sp. AG207R]|uniref:SEC-C metal-binding domain-containing protein n=1 Tax=Rhizobium sp. AG207R TaxID=2802287 RepID=UPI0022ABEDAC|nr:SEC-C metal-binding domain-containing protein [Rhizobium sp. AG207R]MCZ3378432.1 SEC-C domain-containing protein [Rhizobium sp. AG207R]